MTGQSPANERPPVERDPVLPWTPPLGELLREAVIGHPLCAHVDLREAIARELGLESDEVRIHYEIPGRETRHGRDVRLRIEVLK